MQTILSNKPSQKKDKFMLKDEQKSAKTLPQRLAGLNKGRGAWGENLACGVAWRGAFLGCNGAWQGALNLATHNTA